MTKKHFIIAALALAPGAVAAQGVETATLAQGVSDEVVWILNTLLFLIGGFLVFFMAAGFAMLEAGLVRSKNVAMQLTKNVGLFSLAAIAYWAIGYNLMYPLGEWAVDGWFSGLFPAAGVLEGVGVSLADADDPGYASTGSDFFFQLMFCAATASIVSGALAERIKLWPFLAFVVVLTGFIYPLQASWKWGGGWLDALGFQDFAGSTVVHSVGGWAALAGALVLGPRLGKYAGGRVNPMPGSNLALATLGMFILWLGWFGFNGGSQLAMGSAGDVADVSRIFANTNMAASAGAVAALVLTQAMYGKVDLTMVLNGALAGLVSITAEPLAPTLFGALWIGAVGGVIVVLAVPMLDRFKIDDVVGAIPVHLLAGIWGTLVVAVHTRAAILGPDGEETGEVASLGAQLATQAIGIAAVGAFVFAVSLVLWLVLKAVAGIRVSEEAEASGLDTAELGMEAYPEFARG
ncbi:ammonium transporter [Hasllibacter halocynthiae]|uniref:Ammonium transporter n=1 Tax=Hasllibacter halocynthiae TaxID=595589 RepID=A0A2T0X1W0_9RHOB|nr:ammonium transporter [Hasllibacter halocynthiae]PRY92928.1 ammonium transporter [Hasllibacter halocynthiae]